jgi:hypothetical protein
MSNSCSAVVPANAVTHNHRTESLRQAGATNLRTTRSRGYGSRLCARESSLGRDDSSEHDSASPRHDSCPSFAIRCPSRKRGRRECRVHERTHCLACKRKRRTQATTGTPKSLRHSLRNGFTAAPCSSWCTGLVSHHRLRGVSDRRPTSPTRKLDSSIGEPEPHGLTVRDAPHVLRHDRVHRIPPHVR